MLGPLPPAFAETRRLLHRVAEDEMKPAREAVTGRFGLRAVPGGFGTPPFGDVEELTVVGVERISHAEGTRATIPGADPAAAAALAEYFAFAWGVLEELRAESGLALEVTPPQLWPEHFDVAIELGSERDGLRAGYGASPGDEEHDEPYLYVVPWTASPDGELWNAVGFSGAELPYAELLASADRRETALGFYRARRDALLGA